MRYARRVTVRLPLAPVPFVHDETRAPTVPLAALDTVWFQLTGSLCNIACRHCFITSGPREDRVPMIATPHVLPFLPEPDPPPPPAYYLPPAPPIPPPDS